MKCELHFPMPIWYEETRLNNDVILRLCDKIKSIDPAGRQKSNYGGWQSQDFHEGNYPELAALESTINRFSKDCFYDLGYDSPGKIHNFWINRNNRHNFNNVHIHPGAIISGVYYVSCAENTGNLVFPRPPSEAYILAGASENRMTQLNAWGASYQPKPGMIFLFLGHMNHYVEPNDNFNFERISIAFNLGV